MGCTIATAINTMDLKNKAVKKAVLVDATEERKLGGKFDARLPLTVRQKYNIAKSWKAIARNMQITGINMFIRLFETHDMVHKTFQTLKGFSTIPELRESEALVNHVRMVMYTLDEAIASLDDVDFVVDMLTEVGRTHRRLKGFDPDIFWEMEHPFLMAVKETLQDRYTANMEHIYGKVIRFILQTLIDGFRSIPDDEKAVMPVITIKSPE